MKFFNKLKKVIIPYVAISSIFLGTLGCAKLNAEPIHQLEKPKLEYKVNKIQEKEFYTVKKGDSLWKIAKIYLNKDSSNKEVSDKIKEIQSFSGLKANKVNDTQKYINDKKIRGQDGLIDKIYPGQKLITDLTEKVTHNLKFNNYKEGGNESQKRNLIQEKKNKKNYLLGLIPLVGIAYVKIKKRFLPRKKDLMYEQVISSYNNNKALSSIVDEYKDFSKKQNSLEEKIISYIKIGVKQKVASRSRYDKAYSNKLGLTSKIQSMIKQKKKYKEIQNYVKNSGMSISNSTIYRMKKALE